MSSTERCAVHAMGQRSSDGAIDFNRTPVRISYAYRENEGHVVYLPPDASDDVLGQTLLQALERSQFVLASRRT